VSERYLKTFRLLLHVIILVIGLGGATRAMNAGLACPDWPLCFGKFIPDYHPQVYFEFIHRALAGAMGVFTVLMFGKILTNKNISKNIKMTGFLALVIYGVQVAMGALTVLKLLEPGYVTTHLVLGIGFLSLMLWIYLSLPKSVKISMNKNDRKSMPAPRWVVFGGIIVLMVVSLQIVLGGKVASNYAGLACSVDFPLCLGKLVPTLEGLVGLHVMHRLGAYLTLLTVIMFFTFLNLSQVRVLQPRIVQTSRILITLVLVQVALGIANIKFFLPALITVLHTMLAAGIVATVVLIIFLALNGEDYSKST